MSDPGIGWGDLLRVLTVLPVAQREDAARALGYSLELPLAPAEAPLKAADGEAEATAFFPSQAGQGVDEVTEGVETTEPSQPSAQVFWRVASDLPDPQAQTEAPDWYTRAEMPGDEVFESDPAVAAPFVAPLVSEPMLACFLRRHIARPQRSSDTDVPRLLRHLTRHEPIRRWPMREQVRWPGRVCVVFDTGQALYPLDEDLRRVVTLLERMLGARVEVFTTESGLPSVPLDGCSAVVVLSDAGQGAGDTEAMLRWAAWGQRVARAGTRALLLAPLPRRLVRSELAKSFDLALLDDEPTPLRLVGRTGWRSAQTPVDPHDIQPLRAALFGHTYVTPEVLRDLRRTLAGFGLALDVGSEQAVWRDAAVSGGSTACVIRSEQRESVRAAFADDEVLSQAMRSVVVEVMWRHLQAASPFVRAEYARRLVGQFPPGHPWEAVLRRGVEAGDVLAEQACVLMGRGPSGGMAQSVAAYTARFGVRSRDLVEQGGDALQASWLIAHRHELAAGRVTPPNGVRVDRLAWLLAQQHETRRVAVRVLQDAQSQWRLCLDDEAKVGSSRARLAVIEAGPVLGVQIGEAEDVPCCVPGTVDMASTDRVRIQAGQRAVVLESFVRPEWAEAVRFEGGHWYATLADGRELVWVPRQEFPVVDGIGKKSITLPHGAWLFSRKLNISRLVFLKPVWAEKFGVDEFGVWAEFSVKGICQRMRLIHPGEFLMGSPQEEQGRFDDESLHSVVLSQCYWLADTVCTKALWEAVMGKKQSDLHGDQNLPVEDVSWNNITQEFLPKINKFVPRLNMTLPTEAQWEYACRAGTKTLFSFGGQEYFEKINSDGKFGKAVPVKYLPPNPWGLYGMHGNVWEWCADEYVDYMEVHVIDPASSLVAQGEKDRALRVLRGGGWLDDIHNCRSASRYKCEPFVRYDSGMGFRLCRGFDDDTSKYYLIRALAAVESLNYFSETESRFQVLRKLYDPGIKDLHNQQIALLSQRAKKRNKLKK